MAAPTGQFRAGRYIGALIAIIAVLYALVFFTGKSHTPKLGLDLEGGTTVTLTAKTANHRPPAKAELETARQIIERRVNGLGVAEAEVVTQGNDNIVISVPGSRGDQAKQLGTTAKLRFRPVIVNATPVQPPPTPTPAPSGSATPQPSGSAAPSPSASATPSTKAGSGASSSPSPQGRSVPLALAPSPVPSAVPPPISVAPAPPGSLPTLPSAAPTPAAGQIPATPPPGVSQQDYNAAIAKFQTLKCAKNALGGSNDNPAKPLAACSQDGTQKYLLAPTIIEGTEIKNASAQFDTQGLSGWLVVLNLKSHGQSVWSTYTSQHNAQVTPSDVADFVSFTLDGQVVSAPQIQSTINGQTQVTGNFTQQSATDLANALKYGSLPLTFTQSQAETVSPTLGTDQLRAGLLAGGIGLALVVLYSLLYYRALGLVTITSLAFSGVLTYGCLVLLGRYIGFTLTLAGIAGFIVAVGITADSFVVFFERLKDEVREGRSARSAVPRAWQRARRTILSADAVSFLAAAILYVLAAGAVKGFAFTLGLSTILDLVIVFLFTHPLVAVASRSKSFGSARITGLGSLRPALAGAAAAGAGPTSAAARAAARRSARAEESL
ncbi:MAG TPA: protein translocase subunit SecD [Mycobacteriales bacterium]|nr:protein translocase subunit SecD [Mycobacteriales bacterium]